MKTECVRLGTGNYRIKATGDHVYQEGKGLPWYLTWDEDEIGVYSTKDEAMRESNALPRDRCIRERMGRYRIYPNWEIAQRTPDGRWLLMGENEEMLSGHSSLCKVVKEVEKRSSLEGDGAAQTGLDEVLRLLGEPRPGHHWSIRQVPNQ